MLFDVVNSQVVNNQISRKNLGVQTNPVSNNCVNNNALISSDTSMAYRAYGLAKVNENNTNLTRDYFTLSFDDYVDKLNRDGKLEGKDYSVETFGDSKFLELKNQSGLITDRIEYKNGKFCSTEINSYKNGQLDLTVARDTKRVDYKTKHYYGDNQQQFIDKYNLNFETTPTDFVKYLEKNNIKYEIKYAGEEDNNRSVDITEYDKDGNKVRTYWWYYGKNSYDSRQSFISVSDLNDDEEVRRTTFDKDNVEVCDYFYRTKFKNYDNKVGDISKLSRYGVTYNTSPEEFIETLKKNNIPHEVKKDLETMGTNVIEYDIFGNIKSETTWIYKDNNELERICLWELENNGRKRFDFYKDITETMNLRYI